MSHVSSIPEISSNLDWLDNIPSSSTRHPTKEQLNQWIRTGSADVGQIRPYEFCAQRIVDKLVDTAELMSPFTEMEQHTSGLKQNPFERVGRHFFSTRTSIKCANLDAEMHFTEPTRPDSCKPLVDADETLTYADITNSNDIGVIEYMQWRLRGHATGYAFIPIDHVPLWRLASAESKPKSHLVRLVRGETTDPAAMRQFIASVLAQQPEGVHLAFSEQMDYTKDVTTSIRENLVKRQALAYSALCAALVRPHGTVIIKLMDTLTPFTVGLIYLLRQCFAQLSLVKLTSSRPANAERHLILRWRLPAVGTIIEHLLSVNEMMARLASTDGGDDDVLELVPADVLAADTEFVAYVRRSNERLVSAQTSALFERMRYLNNPHLSVHVEWKNAVRSVCLKKWDIPETDAITRPMAYFKGMKVDLKEPFEGVDRNMRTFERVITEYSDSVGNLDQWIFGPMSIACNPTFYLSMGVDRTLMWNKDSWIPCGFALPAGTLLYGESCEEYKSTIVAGAETMELSSSSTHHVLHVIDLLCIDSLQLNWVPLEDRRGRLIELVAGWKDVRVRPLFPISELMNYIRRVRSNWKRVQGHTKETFMFRTSETYYPAGGICFYRLTNRVRAIRSQPILWNWLTETDDLLNKQVDMPGYVCWFEKRLQTTNN